MLINGFTKRIRKDDNQLNSIESNHSDKTILIQNEGSTYAYNDNSIEVRPKFIRQSPTVDIIKEINFSVSKIIVSIFNTFII